MDDTQGIVEKPKRRTLTLLAGIYLILLYLILFVIVILVSHKQITATASPTPTAAPTVMPHILVHTPPVKVAATHEDFSSNQRDWGLYFANGKLEVINGKLILQSNLANVFAIGINTHLAPISEKYYLQADFSTDTVTNWPYGLIFGFNKSLDTHYVFEIAPQDSSFALLKYNSGKWTMLVPFSKVEINPFPAANTLSVYFDKGSMELYINGKLASKYSDTDYFQSKDVGVFAGNIGYRLFVDDLFVYSEK